MPTYVYECAKCGDEFEHWQSFSEDPLKRHAGGCRGKVTKVIQPAGIVLKGSGFYKNDSRSNGGRRSGSGSDRSEKKDSEKKDKESTSSGSDSSMSDSSKSESADSKSSSGAGSSGTSG